MILSHLAEITTEARAHYQVWWAIAHHGPLEYKRALNRFPDFFEVTRVANFRSMLSAAWKPFDRNPKVASFRKLLNENTQLLDAEDQERIQNHLAPRPELNALEKIRHQYVSHRIAAMSAEEIFDRAGITPDQLRDIIEESAEIVRVIQRKQGGTSVVFKSSRGLDSALELLKALQTGA